MTVEDIRSRCDEFMKVKDDEKEKYEEFWKLNHYTAGSYTERVDFEKLNQELAKVESSSNANRLFYLALPPSVFENVTIHIKETCMAAE